MSLIDETDETDEANASRESEKKESEVPALSVKDLELSLIHI